MLIQILFSEFHIIILQQHRNNHLTLDLDQGFQTRGPPKESIRPALLSKWKTLKFLSKSWDFEVVFGQKLSFWSHLNKEIISFLTFWTPTEPSSINKRPQGPFFFNLLTTKHFISSCSPFWKWVSLRSRIFVNT